MKESYRPDLKAHVLIDDDHHVRAIRHTQEHWESPTGGGLQTAVAYLRELAGVYEIPSTKLDRLESRVSYLDPREQGEEYRLSEEKRQFDSETFGFYQTYLNTPVWRAGLKVTIKQGPNRVIKSDDTSHSGMDAKLPAEQSIDRYRRIIAAATAVSVRRRAVLSHPDLRLHVGEIGEPGEGGETESASNSLLREILDFADEAENERSLVRLIRGRFWIYRYLASERVREQDVPDVVIRESAAPTPPPSRRKRKAGGGETPDPTLRRPFEIGPVDDRIREGSDYLVAEITFEAGTATNHRTWRILVEVETNSILYVRPLVGNVNCLVYEEDPITKTGNTALTSASNTATLDPHRDDVLLQNLDAPVGGNQALTGSFAELTQVEGTTITPPTKPAGSDFEYSVRTNEFASVSGYFHVDRIFRTMQDLGFNVSTYMANTVFPIPVDIRCFDIINAHCVGDGMGGIGHVGYGLMDTTDTTNPLGRACDPRVHLHEVLGHGILYENVDGPNFDFAHSAGDGLAGIYFDPESNCKGVDGTPVGKPGDLRFTYVPWHPTLNRRFDRDVSAGWAWGGFQDNGGYGSEEILATTHFNIYRAIGGDSSNLGRRIFASRMMMYLILRAIQNLTPATNPGYAREFAAELMTVDALNWTSEGIFGGAYNKVVRWAFEKQGEYQSPLVVSGGPGDGTINSAGNPQDVDVYIDDGRAGEYQFQHVHWNTTTIWNRRMADAVQMHEEPALGETNFAYVRIKNRGTQQATNVIVRGYHTKPGAGLNWPADFDPLTTAQVNVGTVNANNTEEIVVGPFEWTPNINAYGHDCMLMVVSSDGDPSNIDNFTAGETIPEWRLVPNDNNVGQRNVNPVPGGGGEAGLMAGLDGISFFVGNPNPARAQMELKVRLPSLLTRQGWRVELVGLAEQKFVLASGAKREVFIRLHPGHAFTRDQVEATHDRDVTIEVLADDNLIGGMTYRLDPDLKQPFNAGKPKDRDCTEEAQRLAECLGIKGQKVSKVCVKEIIVGLKIGNDECC